MGTEHHDRGLWHDLPVLLSRRRALGLFGSLGVAAAVAACSSDAGEIPEETAGPFPGNDPGGVNVLAESGIVRSDITGSFGEASGVANGVPLTIQLRVLHTDGSPYRGAAVYLWQCDAEGRYSLYSEGVEQENYLRGIQAADGDGRVTFTSVYPGAYPGRWPHIHFETHSSVEAATSGDSEPHTTQLALPENASTQVYATRTYARSLRTLQGMALDGDSVFSDGHSQQLATVTGDLVDGMTATLDVPVPRLT